MPWRRTQRSGFAAWFTFCKAVSGRARDAEGPAPGEHVVGAGEADYGPIRVGDVGVRERREGLGLVTLPTRLIWYVLDAMLGLMTPNTVRVSASPELMLLGTVKVRCSYLRPRPAVTVPDLTG